MVTIPAGSTLHQIFALDKPEEMGGTEQLIGELVLSSQKSVLNISFARNKVTQFEKAKMSVSHSLSTRF